MLADLLQAESTLLRVMRMKAEGTGNAPIEVYEALVRTYFHDANQRMSKNAIDAVAAFVEGDMLRTFSMGIKRFTKYPIQNVKALRRTVADYAIEKNAYTL